MTKENALVPVSGALAEFVGNEKGQFTGAQIALLKDTVCKGADDNQLALFLQVCKARQLDPFTRQMHAVFRKDRDGKTNMVMQTGIDGLRALAARTNEYAGSDEAEYEFAKPGDKQPTKARVTVWRLINGQKVPFIGVAYWDEFAPDMSKAESFMWKKMPKNQLAKCAEAQALRKGFPLELVDMYDEAEFAQDRTPPKDVSPTKTADLNARFMPKTEPIEVESETVETEIFDFVFPVGSKFAGRKISAVPLDELTKYAESLISWIAKNDKHSKANEIKNLLGTLDEFFQEAQQIPIETKPAQESAPPL